MRPSFQRPAPGRIEVREGGGCLAIFGLPFLLVGLLAALIGFGGLPLQHYRITAGTSSVALMVIGATFTLVGGALVFGRSWTMLSSADRTIDLFNFRSKIPRPGGRFAAPRPRPTCPFRIAGGSSTRHAQPSPARRRCAARWPNTMAA